VHPRLRRHVDMVITVVCISAAVGAGYALAQGATSFELIVT
jgi:hypothetical protein